MKCPIARPRAAAIVLAATALALGSVSCSGSFGMPRGGTEQGRDIFELWQTLLRCRDRRRDDRLRADRMVARPVPAEAVGRSRGARCRVPREPNARGRVRGDPVGRRDRPVLRVVPHRTGRQRARCGSRRHDPRRGVHVGVALLLPRLRGRLRSQRAGRRWTGARAAARAHHPDRAGRERRDPRVLGPGVPLQARCDPRGDADLRPDAHRDRHVPAVRAASSAD